jgi:hypothetical protein
MKRRATLEPAENLPLRKLCTYRLRTSRERLSNQQPARPAKRASQEPHLLYLVTPSSVERTLVIVPLPSLWKKLRARGPGRQYPGPFSDPCSCRPNLPVASVAVQSLRRNTANQEKGDDQLHDGELEDVYDLYNACNGAIHDGLLDIRKLDELSEEETAFLDIPRLREVWHHVANGCAQCHAIINTLNLARERLRKRAAESEQELAPPTDANHVDPLS